MDYTSIRQRMQQKRRALVYAQIASASQKICDQIRQHPAYQRAKHVAIYSAVQGEPSLHAIAKDCWQQPNKTCYLPCVQPGHRLRFSPATEHSTYQINCYGIPEPSTGARTISGAELDLVMMPLVAFNNHNDRLGSGKGYYDRSFAMRKQQQFPTLLGIAYHWQLCHELTPQEHDIPCDDIITDA